MNYDILYIIYYHRSQKYGVIIEIDYEGPEATDASAYNVDYNGVLTVAPELLNLGGIFSLTLSFFISPKLLFNTSCLSLLAPMYMSYLLPFLWKKSVSHSN